MTPWHRVAAIVVAVVLPGASWLDGTGSLAWTMYAKSETYRLGIVVIEAGGGRRRINPAVLAPLVAPELSPYLTSVERWRHAPAGDALRASLPGLARLVCSSQGGASVELTLETRPSLDDAPRLDSFRAVCGN